MLLLSINGAGDNWAIEPWIERFSKRLPGVELVSWPATRFAAEGPPPDAGRFRYAAVWKPPQGLLKALPGLQVIFNLGAGVDALMADPTLPTEVPLVRVVTGDLTGRMTEYVVMHVLMHHRRQRQHDAAQARGEWWAKDQWAARDLRVGVMGLGEIGRDSAEVLARLGFDVAGWSRSPREIPGIRCYAGDDGLGPFLARTDILVVLLPLTPDTRHILARPLFSKLARDGRLGGPVIINAGRGGLQNEGDILACLDDGTLVAATLDVFEVEPLPAGHPFWRHPKVTVSPHNAADSDPDAISDYVVAQIRAHQAGGALANVVDRRRGY
ncbi:MAG: glyoxylate/hydroxypyruvate reductase A [Hyphomicrobiaceae bacterium]